TPEANRGQAPQRQAQRSYRTALVEPEPLESVVSGLQKQMKQLTVNQERLATENEKVKKKLADETARPRANTSGRGGNASSGRDKAVAGDGIATPLNPSSPVDGNNKAGSEATSTTTSTASTPVAATTVGKGMSSSRWAKTPKVLSA